MIMRQLARDVLSLSKEFNDSNEVAITCDIGADMPLDEYGISYGTEHSVQITSDTLSNHILTSADSVSVVSCTTIPHHRHSRLRIYVFSLFILRWLVFPWCQIRERFIICIRISNMIFIKHLLCLRNLPQKQLKILQ